MKIHGNYSASGKPEKVVDQTVFRQGRIERVLSPGVYSLIVGNGQRITVKGRAGLAIGSMLRFDPGSMESQVPGLGADESEGLTARSIHAVLPLAFGGKDAIADLTVFVERTPQGVGAEPQGITFVFTVLTEFQGEVQWCVYLKGKGFSLQVHKDGGKDRESVSARIREIEKNLQGKGYFLLSPSVVLKERFRMPGGSHLNLRG